MVSLFLLLGVSEKHLREDVSTTVSQNAVEGSATFTYCVVTITVSIWFLVAVVGSWRVCCRE